VLFLFTDDQRHDTIAELGNRAIQTPNMDALVRSGTAFTNAHIMGGTSPAVCMPSRAMMLTGRSLFHINGRGESIPSEHTMMPEWFRHEGYATFGTGKWHNSRNAYTRCFSAGNNIFFGGMSDHFQVPLYEFDAEGKYPKDAVHFEPKQHSTDLFADATIDFLEQHNPDLPFFAYTSFTAPHDPRDTLPEYHAMYRPGSLKLPDNCFPEHPFDNGELTIRDEMLESFPRDPGKVREHLAAYYAMITHVDAAIGRIMYALHANGHSENTIVVLAGDNGLAVGQHGLMGKQSLYDHSVHVPLVMAGPGVPGGERRDGLCLLSDIFPTLCDLANVDTPASVEGSSLTPNLASADAPGRDHVYLAYKNVQRGVYDGRHKLMAYSVNGEARSQLFDRASDPLEMHDVYADAVHAEHRTRMEALLLEQRQALGDTRDDEAAFWEGYRAG
jgi:arylsulfatase A-like enzyme